MDIVRVEAFSSALKGKKIWIYGDDNLVPNRLNILEQELLGKGRKVLILADLAQTHAQTQTQTHTQTNTNTNTNRLTLPRWSSKYEWDAIFRIKDNNDLRLSLTYILNAAKPVRVVWLGSEPPQPILNRLTDITVIGYCSTIHNLYSIWDAIFFSLEDSRKIEDILISRLGSLKLSQLNLKSVITELRAVKAGLVWSIIDESEKSGNVYWYDINDGEPPREQINTAEASLFLKEIANYLSHR